MAARVKTYLRKIPKDFLELVLLFLMFPFFSHRFIIEV